MNQYITPALFCTYVYVCNHLGLTGPLSRLRLRLSFEPIDTLFVVVSQKASTFVRIILYSGSGAVVYRIPLLDLGQKHRFSFVRSLRSQVTIRVATNFFSSVGLECVPRRLACALWRVFTTLA